jgi:hypothetical protein
MSPMEIPFPIFGTRVKVEFYFYFYLRVTIINLSHLHATIYGKHRYKTRLC